MGSDDPGPGMSRTPGTITELLTKWKEGREEALDRLIPLVHQELCALARAQMRSERVGHTLQATALVNEAYLRLVAIKKVQWEDRNHFFAVSARLMRRILVDSARARQSEKRGSGVRPISLEEAPAIPAAPEYGLLALDRALKKLEAMDARKVRIVELRYFAGCSVEETATILGVSPRTVKRDWVLAKAWLSSELSGGDYR